MLQIISKNVTLNCARFTRSNNKYSPTWKQQKQAIQSNPYTKLKSKANSANGKLKQVDSRMNDEIDSF